MQQQGLELATLESFYVGGRGKPIAGGHGDDLLIVEQMYVQHLVPRQRTFGMPVIFVHGALHTGMTWETTPDGREGWQTLFVRNGFETYVVDQVSRGRSAPDLSSLAPGVTTDGTRPAVVVGGTRIATVMARGGSRSPYRHKTHAAQMWPDFGLVHAAKEGHPGISAPEACQPFGELLERTGKAVLVTHSQAGDLGWRIARAFPDRVAGIVAVEPARTSPGLDADDFPDIPVYVMWGDDLPAQAPALAQKDLEQARAIARERPKVTVDYLPEHGIFGNGHMLMMEDNNAELAERIYAWLRSTFK